MRGLAGIVLSAAIALPVVAQIPPRVGKPGSADEIKSARQREQVATLARRHLGRPLRGEGDAGGDLEVLQRLLDERVVDSDDVFGQQALGVVLGDVMVRTLPLHWVVVDDDLGHSRALRYGDTPALFFPVTMISKRVQNGEDVDVAGLYADVARQVAELARRSTPTPPRVPAR